MWMRQGIFQQKLDSSKSLQRKKWLVLLTAMTDNATLWRQNIPRYTPYINSCRKLLAGHCSEEKKIRPLDSIQTSKNMLCIGLPMTKNLKMLTTQKGLVQIWVYNMGTATLHLLFSSFEGQQSYITICIVLAITYKSKPITSWMQLCASSSILRLPQKGSN